MSLILNDFEFQKASQAVRYDPGYVMWKGLDLSYLASNDYSAQLLGFNKMDEFIGRDDFAIRCKAVEYADMLQTNTKNMFAKNCDHQFIQYFNFKNGFTLMWLSCTIVKNKLNTPKAIIMRGYDINHIPTLNVGTLLQGHIYEKIASKESFMLELCNQYHDFPLGRRQSQCLYYLLRGLSCKEIALQMNISVRTVEKHIIRIKDLLQCRSRSQLYAKALEMGLLNVLIR